MFCPRLAESSFVAFAADLYHGKVTDTIAGAETLSNALDANQAKADIADAARFLNERAGQGGLAVIGFSLGASFALDLSVADPEHIRSVVVRDPVRRLQQLQSSLPRSLCGDGCV